MINVKFYKIKNHLFNIIFFSSRFVTLFVFSIFLGAVINTKFMISENFFPFLIRSSYNLSFFLIHKIFNFNIDWIVSYSFAVDKYFFSIKYSIYKIFCIHAQQIDLLLITFFIIFIIDLIFIILRTKDIYIIIGLFLVYFVTYLITLSKDFLTLSFIAPSIFIIIKITNNYKFNKNFMLIPVFGEVFCNISILKYIFNKISDKLLKISILLVSVIVSNIIFIFLPTQYINAEQILPNSVYNVFTDENNIIASSIPPCILDGNKKYFLDDIYFVYQDIIYNKNKKNIYVYDCTVGLLYILNVFNGRIEHKIKLDEVPLDIIRARLCCNDDFSVLFIAFEGISRKDPNLLYMFDLKNYKLLKKHLGFPANDFVVYNKFRDSFLITNYQGTSMMQEVNIISGTIENIDVGYFQGYAAVSNRNKELYVALHQNGQIYVYDAETMELKRKIKTNYTVKDITYDEDLNILIAPAYFTGYIDIFLMDGTDKLLKREFVGFELREAKFDDKKENLYICSRKGLYKVPLKIKNLIDKCS